MRENQQRDWKLPAFGEFCPSSIDWAMMAAYLDGEGSILINPRRGKNSRYTSFASSFYLRITVANTDVRLMAWIKQRFGGSYSNANTAKYYEGKNFKTAWHWNTASNRAAWILYNCLTYFVIKREQAELGIQLQESMTQFSRKGRTKELPLEIQEERREIKRKLLVMKARGKTMMPAQEKRIAEVG